MILFQRSLGPSIPTTIILVLLSAFLQEYISFYRGNSPAPAEELKESAIYMAFTSIPLYLLTQDKTYLASPASIAVFCFFVLGRHLLNYRDVVDFYTDSCLPLARRRYIGATEMSLDNFLKHVKGS